MTLQLRRMCWWVFAVVLAGAGCKGRQAAAPVADGAGGGSPMVQPEAGPADAAPPGSFRILLFSRTAGFRHDSIAAAIAALTELQGSGGYLVEATEDPARFTTASLASFQVVVFLLTTGDVLNDTQQAAFEGWSRAGGGFVGIHSAADTEYQWSFYGQLVGTYFRAHPAVQQASVRIEIADHPATAGLPAAPGAAWVRRDEWYDFAANPRPNVNVLATVDESTYSGGTMGADHPIVWAHQPAGSGRSFYTAMGHTIESYSEPLFRQHLVGAIRWAARR
jgi:type 1 glutamine amidotransferase